MPTIQAAIRRFHPITLLVTTSFIGFAPIICEEFIQTSFLVTMVIWLGYGIVFSAVVILIVIPYLYAVAEDQPSLIRSD